MMLQCWSADSNARPTFSELLHIMKETLQAQCPDTTLIAQVLNFLFNVIFLEHYLTFLIMFDRAMNIDFMPLDTR